MISSAMIAALKHCVRNRASAPDLERNKESESSAKSRDRRLRAARLADQAGLLPLLLHERSKSGRFIVRSRRPIAATENSV